MQPDRAGLEKGLCPAPRAHRTTIVALWRQLEVPLCICSGKVGLRELARAPKQTKKGWSQGRNTVRVRRADEMVNQRHPTHTVIHMPHTDM